MRNRIPLARAASARRPPRPSPASSPANALADGNLAPPDMLKMATEIEGHPDNVGAALLGGFVVSTAFDGAVEALRFDVPRDLRCVLYIPELRLETRGDAQGAAEERAVRRCGLEPRPGRPRRRRDGRSADGSAALPDDRSSPRAVPRGGLPAAAPPGRSRARAPGRSGPACRARVRRSSRSPTRWRPSPGSRPRSRPSRPTPTCPVRRPSSAPRNAGAKVVHRA